MRRLIFILSLLIIAISANAEGIFGIWKGSLMGRLPIVINIISDLEATISSPSQGAMNIPCSKVEMGTDERSVKLEIAALNASFEGALNPDNTHLNGNFTQGMSIPLDMERGAEEDVLPIRPQTPKPPYPYNEEEVTFNNGEITLSGTLTIPELPADSKDGYTGVVLISGSGKQNRDEEILGHKPFAVIADYLTRNGIAVLRYDDRGAGKSSPAKGNETSFDNAADAMAAFNYLSSRPEVNSKRTGLIGHSEGGTIAFINAAEHPDKIAFICSLAGMAVKGEDMIVQQNIDIISLTGQKLSDEQTDSLVRVFAIVASPVDSLTAAKEMKPAMRILHPDINDKQLDEAIAPMLSPWYRSFMRINPKEYLTKIKCPVLALNGSWDVQVNPDMNLAAIRAALPSADVRELPKLNHLFQEIPSRQVSLNYGTIPQTISPEVLTILADWISKQ